jgi:hypothetical protein
MSSRWKEAVMFFRGIAQQDPRIKLWDPGQASQRDAVRRAWEASEERSRLPRLEEWAIPSHRSKEEVPLLECEVERIEGETARCLVEVAGVRLPVAFPTSALRAHQLQEGMSFRWQVRETGTITSADIRPAEAPQLTREEKEEYEQLWNDYLADPGDEVWEDLAEG